jgi:hypothetical protein
MDLLTRACWFATWCGASGFKVARRRWVEDVLMPAIRMCRAPELAGSRIGEPAHVANVRC